MLRVKLKPLCAPACELQLDARLAGLCDLQLAAARATGRGDWYAIELVGFRLDGQQLPCSAPGDGERSLAELGACDGTRFYEVRRRGTPRERAPWL